MKKVIVKLFIFSVLAILMCAFVLKTESAANSTLQDFYRAELEFIKLYKEDHVKARPIFKDFIIKYPGTMEYPFEKLQQSTAFLSLIESSDRNVRVYRSHTWVCLNYFEYNIFQYKSEGKVYTRMNIWFHSYKCWDEPEADYVSDIKTVMIEGKTYYLIFAGKYNCGDYSESEFGVTAFTIEKNLLQTAPLFKIQDRLLPNIFVCAIVDNGGVQERDFTLLYDEKNKILYIPESKKENEMQDLTGLWLNYQLKGKHFEYIGKSGPYYLHASIRDFESFVVEMDTKTYHHRIDAIDSKNNKYRLSLWKSGKTIDTKPDLVIEGKYNEAKEFYIFEKNGIRYSYPYFNTVGYFIIETNGKVTLREKVDKESVID